MSQFADKIKTFFKKRISPVFLLLLLLSLILWYLTKLSYTYTSQVPISVNIEGNKFKVTCIAEGSGYKLFSYKLLRKSDIQLSMRDIQATPSVINNDSYVINAYSLQNAISVRVTDLRIISIGEIPEIQISYSQP